MSDVQAQDMVRLTINSRHLDHEIWLPFMRRDQLTADRVMIEAERVLQSNSDWLYDEIQVTFIHAPLPAGEGFARGIVQLETFLRRKKCIIQIPMSKDNMCFSRAVVTAKARLEKDPRWKSIRQGCQI